MALGGPSSAKSLIEDGGWWGHGLTPVAAGRCSDRQNQGSTTPWARIEPLHLLRAPQRLSRGACCPILLRNHLSRGWEHDVLEALLTKSQCNETRVLLRCFYLNNLGGKK